MDKYVTDGDVGCGTPDTPQWHLCMVAQMDDTEVFEYMLEVFGVVLEGDDIKQQARDTIHEYCKGSN